MNRGWKGWTQAKGWRPTAGERCEIVPQSFYRRSASASHPRPIMPSQISSSLCARCSERTGWYGKAPQGRSCCACGFNEETKLVPFIRHLRNSQLGLASGQLKRATRRAFQSARSPRCLPLPAERWFQVMPNECWRSLRTSPGHDCLNRGDALDNIESRQNRPRGSQFPGECGHHGVPPAGRKDF